MRRITRQFQCLIIYSILLSGCKPASTIATVPILPPDAPPTPSPTSLPTSITEQSVGMIAGLAPLEDSTKPSAYFRCDLSGECEPLYWVNSQSTLLTDLSPDRESFISTLYDPESQVYDLFLLNTIDGQWKRLTQTAEVEYLQDWSLTDSEILYITEYTNPIPPQEPLGKLSVLNYETKLQQEVTLSCDIDQAKWINNQQGILFGGSCAGQEGIYRWTRGDVNPTLLVLSERTQFTMSPTKKKIAFNSIASDGESQVMVLNLENLSTVTIPHEPGKKDMGGSWISSDGQLLSFITTRNSLPGEEYIWDQTNNQIYPAPWKEESFVIYSEDQKYWLIGSGTSGNNPVYMLRDQDTTLEVQLKLPASMAIVTAYIGPLPENKTNQPATVP